MDPNIPVEIFLGFIAWFLLRYLDGGIYTVDKNKRTVKTNFGRADRIPGPPSPIPSRPPSTEEKKRYQYPQVRVIMPGGLFQWPWQESTKSRLRRRP
jgi:hypothetical protein